MATTTVDVRPTDILNANVRMQAALRGWNQAKVAELIGVSRAAVSQRYRGEARWTVDEMVTLASAFGLGVEEMLARPKGFEPLTFWFGAEDDGLDWAARAA